MKTFDEYWKEHATDEFLSKEGVKTLCDDMSKELIEENKVFKEGILFFIRAILEAPMTTLIGELQEMLKKCLIKTPKK